MRAYVRLTLVQLRGLLASSSRRRGRSKPRFTANRIIAQSPTKNPMATQMPYGWNGAILLSSMPTKGITGVV